MPINPSGSVERLNPPREFTAPPFSLSLFPFLPPTLSFTLSVVLHLENPSRKQGTLQAAVDAYDKGERTL